MLSTASSFPVGYQIAINPCRSLSLSWTTGWERNDVYGRGWWGLKGVRGGRRGVGVREGGLGMGEWGRG